MTICIGWTNDRAVYLASDSAVTGNFPVAAEYSSFGEKHSQLGDLAIQEGALKIMRHQNSAVAFSGDANRGIEIFDNFIKLSGYLPVREAYCSAWINAHDSFNPGRNAALLGYYDLNGPHLIQFTSGILEGDVELGAACIGNVNSRGIAYFHEMLTSMPPPITANPMDALIGGVCLLQKLFTSENLMPQHAMGGFVAGCFINSDGLAWTADTLHVINRNGLVNQLSTETVNTIAIFERCDTFFTFNNRARGYEAFTNNFGANTGLAWKEVISRLRRPGLLPPDPRKIPFEYIIFHDNLKGMSTIFNVRGGQSRFLKYKFSEDPSGRRDIQFRAYGPAVNQLTRSPQEGVVGFVGP
jgi:hypothetical protein